MKKINHTPLGRQTKMDNIERQSKVDSLHGSLEKTMKAKFKKSIRKKEERRKHIDLGICILKLRLDLLENKIQITSLKLSYTFEFDVSIVVIGLPYNDKEDLIKKMRELER